MIPTGQNEQMWVNIDRVAEYNNTIVKWIDLIKQNEKEKLNVLIGSNVDHVGNYSVSNGVKMSHSESYNATMSSVFYIKGLDVGGNVTSAFGKFSTLTTKAGEQLAGQLENLTNLWAQPDAIAEPLETIAIANKTILQVFLIFKFNLKEELIIR